MALIISPLFSVPFAVMKMERYEAQQAALSAVLLARENDGNRNRIQRDTQHGLFESSFDLHTWPDAPIRNVFGFIHQTLASVVQQLSGFTPAEYENLVFNYHSWFHVTRTGGHLGVHNHPMASWSGIFCVDPGDSPADRPESGSVRFMDPRVGAGMYMDSGNDHLRGQFELCGLQVQHEAGKLVLFPSYLLHEVFPYWGTRPRIVIAFNAWIKGAETTSSGY
jgi:uncharacterized protein (TIGR02466 family)